MNEAKAIARCEEAAALLPPRFRRAALQMPDHRKRYTEEFRLRAGQPPAALLPEGERKKLDAAFEESAKELLAAGVEVGWSKEVKTGFKVGAKEGGYYISFADADIEALLAEYLRDKVFQLLFKA